jgi:hypothetical protein
MSAVLKEEAAERQRAKEAAAAAALAAKQEAAKLELMAKQEASTQEPPPALGAKQAAARQGPAPVKSKKTTPANTRQKNPPGRVQASKKAKAKSATVPSTVSRSGPAAAAVTSTAPVYQGVFCRDMGMVGTLLSRGGGLDRAIPVKCEAMS